MEVKKVANLSQDEFQAVVKAGEILGSVSKALADGEIDEVSDGGVKLITALQEVITKIIG